jgi:hypothetical protein
VAAMGFNRVTCSPGHERKPVEAARFRELARLRRQREARARESTSAHALAGSLMSVAALLGSEVSDPNGRSVGRLRDVVVHWTTRGVYRRVKAIVLNSGKQDFVIGARWLEASPPATVRLRSSRMYAGSVERHPADVALAHDVLDRNLSTRAVYRSFARPIYIWPGFEMGSSWWESKLAQGPCSGGSGQSVCAPDCTRTG